jgi:hypothetical protein
MALSSVMSVYCANTSFRNYKELTAMGVCVNNLWRPAYVEVLTIWITQISKQIRSHMGGR